MPPTPSCLSNTKGPKRSGNCCAGSFTAEESLEALADQRKGRAAEGQQPVVELAQRLRRIFREKLFAQLQDLDLPQGVAQISGIEGAAIRLLHRVPGIDQTLLPEQSFGLFDRHPLGVQADRRQETTVAQERVRQLSELE